MKLFVNYGQDGKYAVYESHLLQPQAKLASNLLAAVMTSDVIRKAMTDEDEPAFSPRKIVAIACDIAQAAYAEFERREWKLELPPPQDTLAGK